MLYPSRFSNSADVAEYSTLAFMYLKVHLLNRLLQFINSRWHLWLFQSI